MHKVQKHIEIIRTTSKAFSSMSLKSCDDIQQVLTRYYSRVGVSTVNNIAELDALIAKQPDVVFMGMKCLPHTEGEEPTWVSDYLKLHGITHIGSSGRAIELERNKPLAKQRILDMHLATPPFMVAQKGESFAETDITLTFPVFIKPINFGGSEGIDSESVIYNVETLRHRVPRLSQKYNTDVLIEEFLPGREFSVALLKTADSSDYMVMPLELIAPADASGLRILSAKIKTLDIEASRIVKEEAVNAVVSELAVEVFTALGGRDYGRVDIRLDKAGKPHFIEANLVPSLKKSPGNYFPKACLLSQGMSYDEVIVSIVELGLARAIAHDEHLPGSLILPIFSPA
jgi:D-alanine-D-alanine ligase